MNIKNNLLLVVKNRWFERGLCLAIILLLVGFFYYEISAQKKQLQNYVAEIAGYEENFNSLREKLDLSDKEIVGLNNTISDYEEKANEQSEKITTLSESKMSWTMENSLLNNKIYGLNEEIHELKEEREYWLPNENEIIIDTRLDPDILAMLIKHAKALNERDYETYKSTWLPVSYDIGSPHTPDGHFMHLADWSSDYHYETEMAIKKICFSSELRDDDEQVIFVDFATHGIDNEIIINGSYYVAVVQSIGKWYVTNYH